MDSLQSYYDLLGVTPDATPEMIERAYHQLARHWHPDVAGREGEAAMRQLNVAVAVLRGLARRRNDDESLAPTCAAYDVAYVARISPLLARRGGLHCTPFSVPDGSALLISIPPGSCDGARWHMPGWGATGRAGARGDLLVTITIESTLGEPYATPLTMGRLLRRIWRRMWG